MTRSSAVVFRLAAALLLAACAASAGTTETAPAAGPEAAWRATASFTDRILVDNDPWTAEAFLADRSYQEGLKKSDAALYQRTFARAAELVDLKGLLDGTATARSIRLGVLKRLGCVFCLQAPAYRAWAEKHLKYLDAAKLPAIEAALWSWTALSPAQQAWIAGKKLDAGWGAMPFVRRHELMREWALAEREALLKANPADNTAMESYYARAGAIAQILGNHELSGVWNRADEAAQASASLAEARAKVGRNADPRVKALLAEATSAADPAARLSALSRLFEGLGEAPSRELLQVAPPRADQRFDDRTRGVVSEMLKTALLKETEGTFAGNDLKEFYATAPLTVTFTTTSLAALGWYMNGGDTLYFNERYVEGYIKSRGLSVEDVMKNPEHLGDLARTLVGTFVHEAQHHRQNFWARQNSVPNGYNQLNEIEAFQVQGLFLLEKLKNDKKFAEFAEREGAHSDVLRAGLGRAKIMEEHGPDMFEYTVPNGHYPETYSNAGGAWCRILWHNNTAKKMEDELARRATLDARERAALESGPQLAEYYESPADFAAALRAVSTGSLTRELARSRKEAAETPKYYNQIRERRERFARETKERHAVVMGGGNGREKAEPPPPGGDER